MRYLFASTVIFILCMPASAQTAVGQLAIPIPSYDVDVTCARDQDPRGRAICVRMEQASYDTLKALWPIASDRAKRYALRGSAEARNSRAFYQITQQYLEAAMGNEQMGQNAESPPKFSR